MASFGFNRKIGGIFLLLLLSILPLLADAQVTRGQLLRLFYKASTYHNNGNDNKAIETYREIATLAPQYPDTYLRMAEIYDEADNVESAVVMYRKYISVEMDDEKVKVPSARLRELELKLGMEHYEEAEEAQAMQLFAKYNVVKQTVPSQQDESVSSSLSASQNNTAGNLQLFTTKEQNTVEVSREKLNKQGESNHDSQESETQTSPSDTKDYARPLQTTGLGNQGLSLFSLSALVETRNEVFGTESEESESSSEEEQIDLIKDAPLDVDADMASIDKELKTTGVVAEEKIELDDAFLAKARLQPSEGEEDEMVAEASENDCGSPLLTYVKRNRLDLYQIDPSKITGSHSVSTDVENLSSILAGKWVSSECNGSGHETWIFNISQTGNVWYVALDDCSGVYLKEDDDFVHESWNAIKSIWAYDHAISNVIKELKAKTVNAQLQNDMLTYTLVTEHQYKPNQTVYTWSRNILEGVTGFIPFGGVVSQVGNSLINYISEKDQQKTYTTTLQFYLKALTPNALRCEYVISEKERSNGGEKEINKERKVCFLYKTEEDYKGFDFEFDGEDNLTNKKLYTLLKEDAETDYSKLYPLAQMAYYGAGTKKSISKAVGLMQELAEKESCQRAKAWLIPVCYNLSMDEEAYPLRVVRKQFRRYADDVLSDLLQSNYPYAYSLQADIYVSSGTNQNQVVSLYEKAASLGDVYALYKLGLIYVEGQFIDEDASKAVSYLTKAAEGGYADAYLQLALLYRYGRLVERDYGKYAEYLFKAVNDGSVKALKELSDAHYLGLGVEPDFDVANRIKECYMRANNEEWKEVLSMYGYNTSL